MSLEAEATNRLALADRSQSNSNAAAHNVCVCVRTIGSPRLGANVGCSCGDNLGQRHMRGTKPNLTQLLPPLDRLAD